MGTFQNKLRDKENPVANVTDNNLHNFLFQNIHPFTSAEPDTLCDDLLALQNSWLQNKHQAPSTVYCLWIAHLAMVNSTRPSASCRIEIPFGLATEAIRKGNLCARGYAFLSTYYAHKRVADRSLSFLREAVYLSPQDPWVKLAEALYHLKIFQDQGRTIEILHGLVEQRMVSPLARYQLACLYVEKGEYEKANNLFTPLIRSYPNQETFRKIQKSLAFLQQARYHSPKMASELYRLGTAFAAINDSNMAERLYRNVLEEMSGRLSMEEKKTAYFKLGMLYETRGDKDNAYISYRGALKLDPHFHEAYQRIQDLLHNTSEKS